jgi:hypothetical protein
MKPWKLWHWEINSPIITPKEGSIAGSNRAICNKLWLRTCKMQPKSYNYLDSPGLGRLGSANRTINGCSHPYQHNGYS